MASWHPRPRDTTEEENSSEEEKIFAGNYMEVLQDSYCCSDNDIDEEVHSKENILVTRIFVRHKLDHPASRASFCLFLRQNRASKRKALLAG